MTVTGTPKFNGIAIATISVDFFSKPTTVVSAKAAFIHTEKEATYGWTEGTGNVWSQETMQKLKDLRASMELDLAKVHLDGVGPVKESKGLDLDTGIGEYIESSTDAQSV